MQRKSDNPIHALIPVFCWCQNQPMWVNLFLSCERHCDVGTRQEQVAGKKLVASLNSCSIFRWEIMADASSTFVADPWFPIFSSSPPSTASPQSTTWRTWGWWWASTTWRRRTSRRWPSRSTGRRPTQSFGPTGPRAMTWPSSSWSQRETGAPALELRCQRQFHRFAFHNLESTSKTIFPVSSAVGARSYVSFSPIWGQYALYQGPHIVQARALTFVPGQYHLSDLHSWRKR